MSEKNNTMNWKEIETEVRTAILANNHTLVIPNTPEYPLAFNVPMPDGHPYENGHLSFQFSDFHCEGIKQMALVTENCRRMGEDLFLTLQLGPFQVNGQYAIKAKYAPIVTMDTAGTLFDYEDKPRYARAAGADGDGSSPSLNSQEQQDMINNAKGQRSRLMETKNGQLAMSQYNEHQEIYNFMFMKSEAARIAWQANGVTQQMAQDTQTKTQPGVSASINPDDAVYGGKTYNENAFIQQLNVLTNTIFTMPGFNITDPNPKLDPNNRWVKAALAALNFGKTSDKNTGNTKSTVNPLDQDGVYQKVGEFSGDLPTSTVEELMSIIEQGFGAAGADEEARSNGWRILDEDERAMVRGFAHAAMEEAAFDKENVSEKLWTGNCSADITGTVVSIKLSKGQILKANDLDISLPAFEFTIDDASWAGTTAALVRERISRIYFVRSMIHDKIESGVRSIISASFPVKELLR